MLRDTLRTLVWLRGEARAGAVYIITPYIPTHDAGEEQSVLSTLYSPSFLIQLNWAEDNYNSIILSTNMYKWSSVCMYVCFGGQLRNERTDWVDFLQRVGQYFKMNGVLPFPSFPRFQDGVLHIGVTTQSSSNGIIFWINYLMKTI